MEGAILGNLTIEQGSVSLSLQSSLPSMTGKLTKEVVERDQDLECSVENGR